MARRAVLGGGSLNPFGGGGVDFGSFNIGASPSSTQQSESEAQAAADRAARLELNRAEIEWNAGRISNADYLAALAQYAGTADTTTTTGQDAVARVDTYRYRFERGAVEASGDLLALLAFDQSSLAGLNPGSEEYEQRLGYLQSTQGALFSDYEAELVNQYNRGQMTTAQLNEHYLQLAGDPMFGGHPGIAKAIDGRLADLQDRVVQELDAQTVSDYQAGKITAAAFIAYGASARSRYAPGTEQFDSWTERLTDANDRSRETALLYRYDLTQKYAQLQKFIQSSAPLAAGTSTSTSTRTILQADGTWKTVKSTSTKPVAPSASEQAAFARRQVEVASAKAQLAEIEAKLGGVGGYVSTASVKIYYERQLAKFAVGSDEWYQVQGKLDDLADRAAEEALLRSQGIRISFPRATSSAAPTSATSPAKGGTKASPPTTAKKGSGGVSSDTGDVGLDQFMAAIAHVESGGRYTAQNKSSGAYGKYQIMPANWAGWAKKYIGDASAAQTPENQEKVVAGKMADLYKWLGDWRAVAHWWLTGGAKENHVNPGAWSTTSRRYVDNVMAGLGKGPTSTSPLAANAKAQSKAALPSGTSKPTLNAPRPVATPAGAAPAAKPTSGPLRVLAGVSRDVRSGEASAQVQAAKFPVGLDAEAFKKFFAQYQAAFQSGATDFSVNTGSGTVHYWVGDDVVERRDLMRNMDTLRVDMFREQMVAYAETGSAETKANQFDQSVEDAARHELMILATVEPSNRIYTAQYSPNPIAQGLTVLDKAKTAIAEYMALADAAFKRGDLTAAYSYNQLAIERAGRTDATLKRFAVIAERDVDAIEKAFGVSAEEALGAEKAGAFQTDLNRLNNFGIELDGEVNKGAQTLTDLLKVVRKYPNGEPLFDAAGPGGQLSLDPRYHFEVKSNGELEVKPTAIQGVDYLTGKPKPGIEGMANIDYLVGTKTVNAFVKYEVGDVGWVTDGAGKRIPLQGKFYNRQRADGSNETWYEDPFSGKWSSTPISYKPGSGFTATTGKNGTAILQYSGGTVTGPQGQQRPDGFSYALEFDDKTGTYVATRSRPAAFMREAVEEVLGSVRPGQFAFETFQQAGFARDLAGLSGDDRTFASLNAPFVGGTARQYTEWRNNFQSPFKRAPSEMASLQAEKALIRAANLTVTRPTAPAPNTPALSSTRSPVAQPNTPALSSLRPLTPIATRPTTVAAAKSTRGPAPVIAPRPAAKPVPNTPATTSTRPVAIPRLPVAPRNAATSVSVTRTGPTATQYQGGR